jgi:hypothetical protein
MRQDEHARALRPAVYRKRDNVRTTVKALRLSPDLTSRVRDRAREERTTVHGAICAAIVLASRDVFADWKEIPLRVMSPISARPFVDVGESCGVFIGATTTVFDSQTVSFWDLARDARSRVAADQTREYLAAGVAAFTQVVSNGANVATATEFAAQGFANEIMVSNLGSLQLDQRFGSVTLKALFGPAVLGFEGNRQSVWQP